MKSNENISYINPIAQIHKNKINTITYSIEVEKIPFLAEFIVWQGEIIRANMEGLLKGINGIYKSWETSMWAINDEIKNDLKNKIYNINLLV